jgi:multiple sugar transport system permease protein
MAFYLPAVASAVVISLIWLWILDPTAGLLNWVISIVGISPVAWLGETNTALVSILLVVFSFSLGTPIILFIAGLNAIPRDLYEAASIDGASTLQEFRHISIPLLRPATALIIVTTTIGTFHVFTVISILTRGGPVDATQTLVYYIWVRAFTLGDFGSAAALSVVLLAVTTLIVIVEFRFVNRTLAF